MRSKYRIQTCMKKVGEPFWIGIEFNEMTREKYQIEKHGRRYVINDFELGKFLIYRLTKTENKDLFVVHLLLLYPREVDLGSF